MADLHIRADGMSVAEVHTGLRQLAAELDAAYRAATASKSGSNEN